MDIEKRIDVYTTISLFPLSRCASLSACCEWLGAGSFGHSKAYQTSGLRMEKIHLSFAALGAGVAVGLKT